MVLDMVTRSAVLDEVFHALADPTRRAVVEQLGRGPAATSQLAGHFEMALPSFVQHLDVLSGCGLVSSAKQGRVRTYQLVPTGLGPAEHWLDAQRRLWTTRLDQLDTYLTDLGGDPT
jgi:DNA-binding transcriptional ArsR family regulator